MEDLRRSGDRRRILPSPWDALRAAEIADRFDCSVVRSNQAVLAEAGIVIIATPPDTVLSCVSSLTRRPDQILRCIAIDVTLAQLAAAAPGARRL